MTKGYVVIITVTDDLKTAILRKYDVYFVDCGKSQNCIQISHS